MKYGCLARFFNPYSEEVKFAKNNGFGFLQLWYDAEGLKLNKDESPVDAINCEAYPAIIHAVLDINEFEAHLPIIITHLKDLGHMELIIHPVCQSEEVNDLSIFKLVSKVNYAIGLLKPLGIELYIENNSKLESILNTPEEVDVLFRNIPEAKFLLDIAHVDSLEELECIIKIKYPDMLHIADRRIDAIHEHLALGKGNIDYASIMNRLLSAFNGKVIFEILDSEDIVESKDKFIELRRGHAV